MLMPVHMYTVILPPTGMVVLTLMVIHTQTRQQIGAQSPRRVIVKQMDYLSIQHNGVTVMETVSATTKMATCQMSVLMKLVHQPSIELVVWTPMGTVIQTKEILSQMMILNGKTGMETP